MATVKDRTLRRKATVRRAIKLGAAGKARLSVFRSSKHIYAQVIDDVAGATLIAACSREEAAQTKKAAAGKTSMAKAVGMLLAERAKEKGIGAVSFDRGGYLYHGRVKALADGAREGGLQF
jgi:large subunit ribosomal protein L18